MSKSIYDEVLDILVDSFTDPQNEDYDFYMLTNNQMMKISKAIKYAKKLEKELSELKECISRFIELLDKEKPTGRDTFDIEILADKFRRL